LLPLLGKPIEVLSRAQVASIHASALQVLEQVGVGFESRGALEKLSRAGCRVDEGTVRFPESLVTKAIEKTPSLVTLKARNPENHVSLGKGTIHLTNGFGATFVLESGRVRPARLKDLEQFTLLSDALELVDFCLKSVIPQDVPQSLADIHAAAVMAAQTDKHIHLSQDCPSNAAFISRTIVELFSIVQRDCKAQDTPVFSLGCTPHSPLRYVESSLDRMQIAIESGIPFLLVSGAIAGVSAPATLAGTLVVQHAELLAGLVYAQILRPGSEVLFGSFSGSADMATGKLRSGSPEEALVGIATQQLCDYCGICYGYGTAGVTESPLMDVQAGYEKGIGLALQMLAGVDVVHDGVSGLLGSAMVASLEQLLIDHEYVRMISRALRGFEVSPQTIALELIREVGPGGSFLMTDHTVSTFRSEFFLPRIFARPGKAEQPAGQQGAAFRSMGETASELVRQILESHRPSPLSDDAARDIAKIMEGLPPN
jgi:trimethylamine--corrinoid protein Co-methyltransferase